MKIGIISNYQWLKQWDNYGTILQNFALQKTLQKLGHESFWILTVDTSAGFSMEGIRNIILKLFHAPDELLHQLMSVLRRIRLHRVGRTDIDVFNEQHPRQFVEFLCKHIPHSKVEYDSQSISLNPPAADAYIVGSDNVWDAVSKTRFLQFGPPESLRIAYAASARWHALSDYWTAKAKTAICRLDYISVREVDGLAVCRNIGRPDAVHVLDPTLLLEPDDYRELIAKDAASSDFPVRVVLGYFLNITSLSDLPWDGIMDFAAQEMADLKIVPLQGAELVIPSQYIYTPSPAQWLNAIDRADFVLTNSFHGAVFCILFKKKFLVIPQNSGYSKSGLTRFTSMLSLLGLEDRIFSVRPDARIFDAINRPIEWGDVFSRLAREKCISLDFLTRSLARN